jgi:hypothetical protein
VERLGTAPARSGVPAETLCTAMPPSLPRRTLLAALGAIAAGALGAGCERDRRGSATGTPSPAPPDPLLADLADERDLLARYDAVAAAHPALASRLAPLRDDHREHAAALARALGDAAPGAPSDSVPAPTPGTPGAALAALATAERDAARRNTRSCLTAPADRAALLASIAACEATHEVLLR